MNKEKREAIMKRLAAERPLPKSELDYSTPYELLVAVVLSAQATDKSVNLATAKLYPVANTPEGIIALGEEGLIPYIRTIGLYRNKAKNVIALSHQLLERFDGVVPRDRDALESLPGVGRKTANVVLNVAFGEATMPVDTHVFRVSNRTGLAKGKTPEEIEEKLLRYLPKAYLKDTHHWILLHGRYCCKASKPDCAHCPILDLCEFKDKTATKVKTED
jgi:endonuclease-3